MILKMALSLLLLLCVFPQIRGDINMHNPRGSNNRADERGRARNNANRLFDSQNNDRGGHNVGRHSGEMYFYAGSELEIQWANQHSCGDQNNFCQVVIQYMCDDDLRDGTSTRRAPVLCRNNCDTNPRYGHHESLTYYEQCALRERNKGLFTATRLQGKKAGESAQHTRQNNAGTRYGFECPEERDYYPYWGPTPWKDIAVFSRNRCGYYKRESQNVKSRWACDLPASFWEAYRGQLLTKKRSKAEEILLYNDKESCESVQFTYDNKNYQAEWKEFPSHGIDPPKCLDELFSRDNHQGNTIGGEFLTFKWQVPDVEAEHCTLRIRYNISTDDFDNWETDHTKNVNDDSLGPEEIYINYKFEGEDDPESSKEQEAFERGYFLNDDPEVNVFNTDFELRLALDTAQYGRTFQDRSHSFAIRKKPNVEGKIYNLNVRGKRGNIVQVYPSTEYDFVPNVLEMRKKDYVHVQWTGSDRNPRNNAGQGRRGTDRNNLVQLGYRPYEEGENGFLTLGTNYPRELGDYDISDEQVNRLAFNGGYNKRFGVELDRAKAYYDNGLLQMNDRGIFYYFCTRNNNFSNRDQKGTVIIK